MNEIINFTFNYLGLGNVLTIIIFFISLFAAYYFYYKNFYRLAYSINSICKNCNKIDDCKNNETEITSRILFFNNGKKTITEKEINQLEIKSTNEIKSVKILKGNDNIKTIKNISRIKIDIDHLDSSEFFVLEINHNGKLDVIGRISETGKLLHNEPKEWKIFNIVFLLIFFILMFYYSISTDFNEKSDVLKLIINVLFLFGITIVIGFIHSILFIPTNIYSKYLDAKNKFSKEFKN